MRVTGAISMSEQNSSPIIFYIIFLKNLVYNINFINFTAKTEWNRATALF